MEYSTRAVLLRIGLVAAQAVFLAFWSGETCSAWAGDQALSEVTGRIEQLASQSGGGLAVQLGCGDGRLLVALGRQTPFLIEGLDRDAMAVEAARRRIVASGLAGKVRVDHFDGRRLPYVDNLVRLLVVSDAGAVERDELLRVLCPGGVMVATDARLSAMDGFRKPWPEGMDEWTHYLHDAGGNAVAHDTLVGPPRYMQWLAAPRWSRNHHTLASLSSVVSAAGRIFCIVDEATPANMDIPGQWSVVARDAFSGALLWKQPFADWAWHLHRFRSGPVQLPRTLVATDRYVFVPLGISAPVSALDAATGRVVRTYDQTHGTEEVIFDQNRLLVVAGDPASEQSAIDPARRGEAIYPNRKRIVAVDPGTGQTIWQWEEPEAMRIEPLTLAAWGGRVFFAAGRQVVCLDGATGNQLWRAAGPAQARPAKPAGGQRRRRQPPRGPGWSVATLVACEGVVLYASGGQLVALQADDGGQLWHCPCAAGFRSPADVFVIGGLVWLGPHFSEGRDLRSGEVKQTNRAAEQIWTVGHHHRCYREKATERFVITGYRGIELLELSGSRHSRNNWIRGVCQYGVLPCNGLIYAPPHACGCFMEAKLYGFWAVAPRRQAEPTPAPAQERLHRGPAYGQVTAAEPAATDWPTLRHDPLRSGSTEQPLPVCLQRRWRTRVGRRLTAPVVACRLVLVADVDTHRVIALDAEGGQVRWEFIAGGRVDSPPTVHAGLALFGSADGCVYALRLADGQLVWRFQAAPEDRKTVAFEQVESVWPVHGSVLVHDGVAYFAAGRSSYLDGGMWLYGVDPASGKRLFSRNIRTGRAGVIDPAEVEGAERMSRSFVQNAVDYKTFVAPDRSDAFSMAGVTNDVLVSDGRAIYLRHMRFDRRGVPQKKGGRHLFSTSSLLDDSQVHRTHWVLGTGDFSRLPVAYSWIAYRPGGWGSHLAVPFGMMLAFADKTAWAVRRGRQGGYTLLAMPHEPLGAEGPHRPDFRPASDKSAAEPIWSVTLAMYPRAVLRAEESVLLGGTPEAATPAELAPTYAGKRGGLLQAFSVQDGSKRAERRLESPPVWDGMAAASGRLYLATMDGHVVCLGD
ncbi:MAG TPA: methyltransferase domain-containing protein [Planctomycetaceae bacterium]|nr:methyltransferase domain-containing protein [Planctomycetaceae bacterium]